MIWSRFLFETQARNLRDTLHEISTLKSDNNNGSWAAQGTTAYNFALLDWKIQSGTHGNNTIYLTHDAITLHHHADLKKNKVDWPQEHTDDSLEDETIPNDPEQFVVEIAADDLRTQWSFSIVYSDTYQVPVLYFHVQDNDGTPCSRNQVLQWLQPTTAATQGNHVNDTWEFVSQEQHPHTGLPSYFLHPCRTLERMKLLLDDHASSSDATEVNVLWAWMSMILPAVNHPIPSALYHRVLAMMKKNNNNVSTNS